MKLVLIAAAPFELEPARTALEQIGDPAEAFFCGIGAINAAKRATLLGTSCRGRDVIFLGTCGTFADFRGIEIVRANEVYWSPTCERLKMSYTVKDSAPPIYLPNPRDEYRGIAPHPVLCSPTVSLVNTLPEEFTSCLPVENLELYSCIGEIAAEAKSLVVLLAVTNSVGVDSHSMWKKNFIQAANILAKVIVNVRNVNGS